MFFFFYHKINYPRSQVGFFALNLFYFLLTKAFYRSRMLLDSIAIEYP